MTGTSNATPAFQLPTGVSSVSTRPATPPCEKLSYAAAAREYREFLAAHPTNRRAARVYYNLADTYRWLGDDEKARQTALQALKTVKGYQRNQFHYYLVRLYVEKQRYREALLHLSHLDSLSSRRLPSGVTSEEIQYFKGLSLARTGEEEKAQDAFRQGGSGRPTHFGYMCREQVEDLTPSAPEKGEEWLKQLLAPRAFYWSADEVPAQHTEPLAHVRELLFLGLTSEAALAIKRAGRRLFRTSEPTCSTWPSRPTGEGCPGSHCWRQKSS